jgi:pimeloyl-ACP methyl ester carboxylesterase
MNDSPVLVISGLGAPEAAAKLYGRALETRGLTVFTVPQRWLGFGDVRVSARLVGETVERVSAETGAAQVKLVGMSLGGLIGLYYLKCAGGAPHVERFVSVGGPLNGSTVARLAEYVPSQTVHALTQTCPDSALMRELREAPTPAGVRMYSVGTCGDVLTPRSSWDATGLEPVETPYGAFPIGHWLLFTHPGNLRVVAELLAAP